MKRSASRPASLLAFSSSCQRLERACGRCLSVWRGRAGPQVRLASAGKCITFTAVRFTWDPRKAASNARKHGGTFEEAASVFADPLALAIEDAVDSGRTLLIGLSERMRILVAVYTEIDEDTLRIISARRATSHERRHYEEDI